MVNSAYPQHKDGIKVIILDDHLLFRIGLRSLLDNSNGRVKVVMEAASGEEFFSNIESCQADVLLLDISLDGISGVEVAKRLREQKTTLKILVLSAESRQETVSKLMETGIEGFISKNSSKEELLTAIEYVADGAEYFGRDVARIIHCVRIAKQNVKDTNFTPRELEMVTLCSKGLTAREIAQHLNISLKTVMAHKYNIFKKLGINNSVELVKFAVKNGIIEL